MALWLARRTTGLTLRELTMESAANISMAVNRYEKKIQKDARERVRAQRAAKMLNVALCPLFFCSYLEMSKLKDAILSRACALVIGIAIGVLIAMGSFRTVELVDIDTGQIRTETKMLWIAVRTTYESSLFASTKLPDGKLGLTGFSRWIVADVKFGNSKKSDTYAGGSVIHYLRSIDQMFGRIQPETRARVKETILKAIRADDWQALKAYQADELSFTNQN